MSRGRVSSDDEDDDEETLELKLKAIEARLKLKKLKQARARRAESEEGDNGSRTGSRANTSTSAPIKVSGLRVPRDIPRPQSAVQVPGSPVRNSRAPDVQKSPARVLLGIDKGLRAHDVSLKRASSFNHRTDAARDATGSLSRANSQRGRTEVSTPAPRGKSFSERIAESRLNDKERQDKLSRIESSRSRGFGVSADDLYSSQDLPGSRTMSSLSSSSTRTESRAMAPPVNNTQYLQKSRSLAAIEKSATPRRSHATTTTFSSKSSASNTRNPKPPPSTANPSSELSNVNESIEPSIFETFSGFHLSKRLIPHNTLTRTLDGKSLYNLPKLLKEVKGPEYDTPDVESDYVVLGIIASKSSPLTPKNARKINASDNDPDDAANGPSKFMVLHLTDLKWEIDLFLFDTGFSQFWKLSVGTIIAVLNPEIMPPRNRATGQFSLKLSSSEDTVLEIGMARDLGFCKAIKKDGKECRQWIDGRKTEYCDFHVELAIDKSKRGRMEVNTMTGFGKGTRGGGGSRGGRGGSGGRGGGQGGKDDGLVRQGRFHDRNLHETVYIAPGSRSAAQLLDEEDTITGVGRAEAHRKRLADQERERELAKRLGEAGNGMGAAYMKARGVDKQEQEEKRAEAEKQKGESLGEETLSLLGRKAGDVTLSPVKRKRSTGFSSTNKTSEPMGWGGAFQRGLPVPKKKEREEREVSPAKKKARFMLEKKGIREPGRDSLGGMDIGLIAAMDEDDDDDDGLEIIPSMRSSSSEHRLSPEQPSFYAIIAYEDPYVQPLILSALNKRFPDQYNLIPSLLDLPSTTPSPDKAPQKDSEPNLLQILPYESLFLDHALAHPTTSLINAYIIRKALIRKHYLATTVANWIVKNPDGVLKTNVVPGESFEVDYVEFLDEAVLECWGLRESWDRNTAKETSREERVSGSDPQEREWWILKPGLSDRGQGIRLFSSEEELTAIFEEWDPDSDSDSDDDNEISPSPSPSENESTSLPQPPKEATSSDDRIITSHLRHFTAQPYIHPPLLLPPPGAPADAPRKFHIRTYVLAYGALRVFVYKPMLALFAAAPYVPPWVSPAAGADVNSAAGLRAHLTNTCLQETGEREGSVGLFWELPDAVGNAEAVDGKGWKEEVFQQICAVTGEVFEAAARGMGVHFQPLPNAFEVFGLDFLVKDGGEAACTTYLLEVNAFPDFKQTGVELRDLIGGLWEGVVDVAVGGFFGLDGEAGRDERMVEVLDIDLGRR
ncbi:TTL-domain-containing protein [Mytilinidion resinicola]|uniref:TTL-domain-containing protein n=1 Tax=Mytilinidion resinicola TaxID=574789 RepID=A0A6A6Z0B3_9PEZI|nr:TTL-domain-containing protein [Mytilinidion resinicola]KAF2814169.1 TTL-domain-containing protein [Mytilinidion resinicola]